MTNTLTPDERHAVGDDPEKLTVAEAAEAIRAADALDSVLRWGEPGV